METYERLERRNSMEERVYDPNDYNTLEDVSKQIFRKCDAKIGHFSIAIIRSMWSLSLFVKPLIGTNRKCCQNVVFGEFPSFSCNDIHIITSVHFNHC